MDFMILVDRSKFVGPKHFLMVQKFLRRLAMAFNYERHRLVQLNYLFTGITDGTFKKNRQTMNLLVKSSLIRPEAVFFLRAQLA